MELAEKENRVDKNIKFTNIAPVFLVENIEKTTDFYVNSLGFKYAKNFDKKDNFAAIYRDSVEIILVQKTKGDIQSNKKKYGNGFDVYINIDTKESLKLLYQECKSKNIKIFQEPCITDYGSYEFAFVDIDGRNIGIGLIVDQKTFFENSNYLF